MAQPEFDGVSWICPRCGRRFAHEGQFHSHDTIGVADHFADPPAEQLRVSFDKLIGLLPADVRVEALKTVIILSARTTFAFLTVQRKRLTVCVFLNRRLESPRIVKVDVISSSKIANMVEVQGPDHVDDELGKWLREAYQLHADSSRPSP